MATSELFSIGSCFERIRTATSRGWVPYECPVLCYKIYKHYLSSCYLSIYSKISFSSSNYSLVSSSALLLACRLLERVHFSSISCPKTSVWNSGWIDELTPPPFFCHAHGMWNFLGQGLKSHHMACRISWVRDLSRHSDSAGSLTHWATGELLNNPLR